MDTPVTLAQVAAEIERGNKQAAQTLLAQLVAQDNQNESAWLMLAGLIEDRVKAIEYLERVLKINPNNTIAREKLNILIAAQVVHPQTTQLASVTKPTPPVKTVLDDILSLPPSSTQIVGKKKSVAPKTYSQAFREAAVWVFVIPCALWALGVGIVVVIVILALLGPVFSGNYIPR